MSFRTWSTYRLERLVLRGPTARLAIVLSLLGVVAVLGGSLAFLFPGHHFESYPAALWWALLRLSDPGYLSDDVGLFGLRFLSLALSVVGMSILVGGIVAIVTGWLNASIDRLKQARTPVFFTGHIVLIGWTDRSPRLLQVLVANGEKKIVVFVPEVTEELLYALSEALPSEAQRRRVILRSGSAYRAGELSRAACARSRVVILAASHRALEGDVLASPRLLKTLIALRQSFEDSEESPRVVVELPDKQLVSMVEKILPNACTILTDQSLARLIRLALLDPRSLDVISGFLDPQSEYRLHTELAPQLVGKTLAQWEESIAPRQLVGLVRKVNSLGETRLILDEDALVQNDDVALSVGDGGTESDGLQRETIEARVNALGKSGATLVLGFNATVPDLLVELARGEGSKTSITLCADVSTKWFLAELEATPDFEPERLEVQCIKGNPSSQVLLSSLELNQFERIFIAANRSASSSEDSDVEVLAIALALFEHQNELSPDVKVVIEILKDENEDVLSLVPYINTPNLAADFLLVAAEEAQSAMSLYRQARQGAFYLLRVVQVEFVEAVQPSRRAISSRLRKEGMALISVLGVGEKRSDGVLSLRALVLKPQKD